MKCEKCGGRLKGDMAYTFKDRKVCDDCYIDLIIGVPDVDISKLSPEIQSHLYPLMKNWHRDRPNRHHVKFPKLKKELHDDSGPS
ncbi:MAG: hypothetical protein V2J25_06235 [Desulfatiglans sp.]|jgi:hypothetical protein|nr:hypothetical protein [Thermodesulfobacteriota bacterium]MEE4352452.1 hypothetical protein [Desulfatiglans sp.]